MIQKTIDVYLNRSSEREHVRVVQWDSGRKIVLQIRDGDIPSGAVATVYVEKPSGHSVFNTAEISGNNITVSLSAQMLAERGTSLCQVQVAASGELVTTFYFVLDVEEKLGADAEESTDESTVYEKAALAAAYCQDSEAWAVGKRDGIDVQSDDDTYHNNSKYYASQAASSEQLAASAKSVAQTAATSATASAAAAQTASASAAGSASDAAASASAAAAIVTVANDGMVVIDEDDSNTEYAVTFRVENHHLIATMTPASAS